MLSLGLSLRFSKRNVCQLSAFEVKAPVDRKALYDEQLRYLEKEKWKNISSTFLIVYWIRPLA